MVLEGDDLERIMNAEECRTWRVEIFLRKAGGIRGADDCFIYTNMLRVTSYIISSLTFPPSFSF
jgi:hypothetical protein